MGVDGLWELLAVAGTRTTLESLSGQRVAVDSSLWLMQFLKAVALRAGGEEEADDERVRLCLRGMMSRICKLLFFGVRPVLVFDGPAPAIKRRTLQQRRRVRESGAAALRRTAEKILLAQMSLETVRSVKEFLKRQQEIQSSREQRRIVPPTLDLNPAPRNLVREILLEPHEEEEEEDEEQEEENEVEFGSDIELPEDLEEIDIATLTNLPISMQYSAVEKMRSGLRKEWREEYIEAVQSGQMDGFSSLQMRNYLKTSSFNKKMSEARKARLEQISTCSIHDQTFQARRIPFTQDQHFVLQRIEESSSGSSKGIKAIEKPSQAQHSPSNSKSVVHLRENWKCAGCHFVNLAMCKRCKKCGKTIKEAEEAGKQCWTCSTCTFDKNLEHQEQCQVCGKYRISKADDDLQDIVVQNPEKNAISDEPQFHAYDSIFEDLEDALLGSKDNSLEISSREQVPDFLEDFNLKRDFHENSEVSVESSSYVIEDQAAEIVEKKASVISPYMTKLQIQPQLKVSVNEELKDVSPAVVDVESNLGEIDSPFIDRDSFTVEEDSNGLLVKATNMKTSVHQIKNTDEFWDNVSGELSGSLSVFDNPNNLTESQLNSLENDLKSTVDSLEKDHRKSLRDTETVTSDILQNVYSMLELMGIPYIVSPAESEAQCAFLNHVGLVDAVITNDSDVFLFGATTVIKNAFDQKKFVEKYRAEDIERMLGLDREKLVMLALLLGSDYTEGVNGIGIVNALEVLHAFDASLDGLREFKQWVFSSESVDKPPLNSTNSQDDPDFEKKTFKFKHKALKKSCSIPDEFPSVTVVNSYLNALIDDSEEPFSWSLPNVENLKEFCKSRLGWDEKQFHENLDPVLNRSQGNFVQSRMSQYFAPAEKIADIKSSRLKRAVSGLTKDSNKSRRLK